MANRHQPQTASCRLSVGEIDRFNAGIACRLTQNVPIEKSPIIGNDLFNGVESVKLFFNC
jgi:hypothetical protein